MNAVLLGLKVLGALLLLWAFTALVLLVGWWRWSRGEPPVESEEEE